MHVEVSMGDMHGDVGLQMRGGAYDKPDCAGVLPVHLAGEAARVARRGR